MVTFMLASGVVGLSTVMVNGAASVFNLDASGKAGGQIFPISTLAAPGLAGDDFTVSEQLISLDITYTLPQLAMTTANILKS